MLVPPHLWHFLSAMLRHPGQASHKGGLDENSEDHHPNTTMHLDLSDEKISKQAQQSASDALLATATMASEAQPIEHSAPSINSTNSTASSTIFSPSLAATTVSSTTTIDTMLASLSSSSGQTSTTLHIVTPGTGTGGTSTDDERKFASPHLRRHPGAPLPRRVSDYSSSNEEDANVPTTVKVATTAGASERVHVGDDKAMEAVDTFPMADFRFYDDGTFGVNEKKMDKKECSKPKGVIKTKSAKKTTLLRSTSGELPKKEKPTKEKSAKKTKKTPASSTAAIAETKKDSGRYRVTFNFSGVGKRNVGTYSSMEIAAYARASANRKRAQLKTSDDAFGTKDAVDQAMKTIRAHVAKALLNRQRAIDLQKLITKKPKGVDVSNDQTKTKRGGDQVVNTSTSSEKMEADGNDSNKPGLPPSTPPVVEGRIASDKINSLLPNGISLLPSSGHYQVSIFFLGERRKVGVYDSLVGATAANDAVKKTLRSYLLKRSVMNGISPDPIDANMALEAARKAANAKIAALKGCKSRNLPLKKRLLEQSVKEFSLPLKKRIVEDDMLRTAVENTGKTKLLPLKKRLLRAVPAINASEPTCATTSSDVIYLDGTSPHDAGKNTEDKVIYLDGTEPDKKSIGRMYAVSIDDHVDRDKASGVDHGNMQPYCAHTAHQSLDIGCTPRNEFLSLLPMPGLVGWQSFPINLMQFLSSTTNPLGAADVICERAFAWNPDGLSFVCTNPGKLTTASAHAARFFNDLYAFGFNQHLDGSYFHPFFQRDNSQLCLRMEPSAIAAGHFGTSYKPFAETQSDANGIYYDVWIPRIDPMDGNSLFGFNFLPNRDNWTCISTHTGSLGPWLRNGDYIIDVNNQPMYTVCEGPVVSTFHGCGPGSMTHPQQQQQQSTFVRKTLPFPLESVIKACSATEKGHPLKLRIFRPHPVRRAPLHMYV